MRTTSLIAVLLFGLLCGCGKNNPATTTATQTATVTLKDGTSVTGSVMKSDTSSITVQGANGVVSTYPMSQVSSINYGPGPSDPSAQNAAPPMQNAAPPPQNPPVQNLAPPAPEAQTAPPPSYTPRPERAADREYQPAPTYREIPAGTTLEVRADDTIDSKTASPGQTFPGSVVREVVDSEGRVAIPQGATATLVVRDANAQGKIEGRSELAVDVASVQVDGHRYRLETSDFVQRGKEGLGANKRTAEFTGGGGLFGTIIGAVAGGGKGAAIGALSGAAAGATTQTLTRGKGVRIPAETVMRFQLSAPIRIREMR